MGMGVKIFTRFTDRSILISSTFQSHAIPGPNSLIVKNLPSGTPKEAWESHKKHALEMVALGKVVANSSSLANYIELSKREEELSQYV